MIIVQINGKFKVSTISNYNGSKDPLHHLEAFRCIMDLHIYNDVIKYRAFLMTFKDKVSLYYITLKLGAIIKFIESTRQFLAHFSTKRRFPKTIAHLMIVK